jgi:hypothetical protein
MSKTTNLLPANESHTIRLTAPDGAGIDITVRSTDRQAAERWIATFREAHDLRERPPAHPKGTPFERAIARAFPILGGLMFALMAMAVLVALAQCIGIIEPWDAAVLVGRLLMLAVPLVCLVLALIGIEARLRRSGGKARRVTTGVAT